MTEGFTLLPPRKGLCQECARDHKPDQPHDSTSLHYQYHFRSKNGRWPTWKCAIAHCAPEIREAWEAELKRLKHWTEPASEVPDVCPTEEGTIGTVQTLPIDHDPKKPKKGRKLR